MKNYNTPVKKLFYYLLTACLFWQSPIVLADPTTIHRDDWYLSQPDDRATIQMSGHSAEEGAIAYINEAGLSGEIGYYQTKYKNRPWFAVTYGSFKSLDDARSQLGSLPENLQNHAPWPRSFKAIKSLIDVASVPVAAEDKSLKMGPSQEQEAAAVEDIPLDASWEEGQAAYDSDNFAVAFKIWTALAKEGDELSQFNLGVMYSRGEGTRKNGQRALEWYMRSAEQGYAPAQFNLGAIYLEGKIIDGNQQKAAAWWQQAAEQGFVQAQFNLASLYCRGIGVTRDQEQCKFWYGQAASNGDTHAQKMLDHIIASENALKTDEEQAKIAETEVKVAEVTETEPATEPDASQGAAQPSANETVEAAAETELDSSLVAAAEESLMEEKLNEEKLNSSQELAPAVRQISSEERVMLSKAQSAFTRSNYMKSHDLWLPLAESGIAEAQYSLGFLYQSGWGLERDLLQAVAWYTSAAEQNEARAQFNLGILLLNGEDNVEKDTESGVLWLTRSADAGNTRAKEFLIDAYKYGKYGIEKSTDKVEYWKSR